MKNEEYRRAFDNLNVPADMAERIRRAAAENGPEAEEKAPAVLPFSRRKLRRVWREAAACAVAAALGVLIWKGGFFPGRADRTSGAACPPAAQNGETGSGSSSGSSSAGSGSSARSGGTGTGKTSGNASGKTSGEASGEASGNTSGNASGKASGKTSGNASGKASGKTSGNTSGNASGKGAGEITEKTPGTGGGSSADNEIPTDSAPNAELGTNLQISNPTQAVSSPADLEGKLNFTPTLPAAVPAGWQVLSCAAIGGKLAQIVYADGSGGEVCWRTALGGADVSGDDTDYPETNLRGGVTYRGADGTVSAAGWTDGGAAFSLTFFPAVTADAAAAWAAAVKG